MMIFWVFRGRKKFFFRENEPTGFTIHGRKEKNPQEGFRRRGNLPLKTSERSRIDPGRKEKILPEGLGVPKNR